MYTSTPVCQGRGREIPVFSNWGAGSLCEDPDFPERQQEARGVRMYLDSMVEEVLPLFGEIYTEAEMSLDEISEWRQCTCLLSH